MRICFEDFEFDPDEFELRRSGARIELEPRVLHLLAYLLTRPGRLVSKDELIKSLWGGRVVSESSLTRSVSALRSALGDARRGARILETVHGLGYRFIAEVGHPAPDAPHPAAARMDDLFVGRRAALRTMQAALESATAGRGVLVLLSGEAGIGKSRTAELLLDRASRLRIRPRIGRCREEMGAPPLWPWIQILRQEVEDLGAPRMRELMGAEGPDIAHLVPELSELAPGIARPPGEETDATRFRLFDSTWRYLRRACGDQPRLLLLEDVHCADPSSLAILRLAASEIRSVPMLCIATVRAHELAADPIRHGSLAATLREPASELIELDGLSASEIAELASRASGRSVPIESGKRLRSYTGGNPFFLGQILPRLRFGDDGLLPEKLPPLARGVRSVLAREIGQLSDDVRHVLEIASVCGREFAVSLVASVGGMESEAVLERLQPAIGHRLVEELPGDPGGYRFVHELVRGALYDELTELARERLHFRAGEALEKSAPSELGPHLAELAHHFTRSASVGSVSKAIHYSHAAGEWARERMAYEDAARSFRSALDLLDQDATASPLRCDVLIGLTEAEARSGRRASAAENGWRAAEAARALGDPVRLARSALAVSPGFFALETGVFDARLASLLELAATTLEPRDEATWGLQARLLGRLAACLYWSGRTDQIESVRRRAAEASLRAGTDEAAGHALAAEHAAHAAPGLARRRLAISESLIAHAERCPDPEQVLMGRVLKLTALLELGRAGEYERELSRFERTVERHRQPEGFWYARMYRAARALMAGHFEDAERLAREFLALGQRIDDRNVLHCFAAHSLTAQLERSLGDEVVPAARAHAERHPEYPTWQAGLVWGCAETGRIEQGARLLTELMDRDFARLPRDINWLSTAGLLAHSTWLLRADRHAGRLYDALAPYSASAITSGFGMIYFGSVECQLARLAALRGCHGEALKRFERAVAWERNAEAEPWLARTQESLAEVLLDLGQAGRAGAVASEALATADRLGMVRVSSRLRSRFPDVSG